MMQLPLFEPPIWTVGQLTHYLRDLLEGDEELQDLRVIGEISNFARPASGHLYFTLKDSTCSLKCVMWRNAAARLNFPLRDGLAVEVHGSLGIYETAGQYQLYADQIRPAGEGALYQEFLRLKARLEAEGLFDPARKRPLPAWPQRIGIVTSPTGAALRDMLNTLRRRYPLVEVTLAPTAVQGEEAPQGIIAALQALNQLVHPDIILVARGGGSIEDLWAFNDEGVARAIAASPAPVISGVGHETDFTIADFVSDLRAPTPTAAAELATPNRLDLSIMLDERLQRLARGLQQRLSALRWKHNGLSNQFSLRSPLMRIRSQRQQVDELSRRLGQELMHQQQIQRLHLAGIQQRLATLNPAAILRRGYALVVQPDGKILRSVTQVSPNQEIVVRMQDGALHAQIKTIQPLGQVAAATEESQ
ncbi:MAG: exodeoxyribonuclease VII large subunit [Anaerolineales bacterium]|nr:exodeoxyribonuclease VII large subunit [Anaerolineales bacterium]